MKALPASAADLIPSIAIDALLARRDAAVAHLKAIAESVKNYQQVGLTIWPKTEIGGESAPFSFREPISTRAMYDRSLDSEDWLPRGVEAVDAAIWDHLLSESGLWTFFDTKARTEWREQIDKKKTPALTVDNIRATFETLYASRATFFQRGVVEVFRKLSWNYKTNLPVKFGKRIILKRLVSFWGAGTGADGLVDLDRAFHILDGKPEPDHRSNIKTRLEDRANRGTKIETPYFELKTFKNGNGHVAFTDLKLVDQLNTVLAKACPNALPHAPDAEASP